MNHPAFSPGILWEGLELVLPALIDLDLLLLVLLLVAVEALLLAVQDQLLRVIRVQRRQDGEEVLPGALAALGVLVGEIISHPGHLDAALVELGHRYLVVLGRVADLDLRRLHQQLLLLQDLLQKRSRHHVVWRHIVLAAA